MLILNTKQIRDWDTFTIENEPILSIDLMERASQQLFSWIEKKFSQDKSFLFLAGMGNNGGDALALARIMYNAGYSNLKVALLQIGTFSTDCEINFKRLQSTNKVPLIKYTQGSDFPEIANSEIVIDGIFGSGLTRPIAGYWAEFINYINKNSKTIISIDVPSGFFADQNTNNQGAIIQANYTLTFQLPKLGFLFAENHKFVGTWVVLDIGLHPDFLKKADTVMSMIEINEVRDGLKIRKTFDHKGTYGHAFLIAGSYQKTGAAVLAAKACLRSGVGLVTVHVPESGRLIMQTAVPEAMVCIDETEMNYCESQILENYTAVGIGPGIGKKKSMQAALKRLLENNSKPIVLDADALNIIAENPDWLSLLPKNAILTPHPGEFDRLTRKHNTGYERFISQIEFSKKYGIIIVLKGAFTSITDVEGKIYFNSTGNPGMATAGSGDVLTGIILSLLAQNYTPVQAATIGVFLHGYAGDLAASKFGFEALIASDIINELGKAFNKIKMH